MAEEFDECNTALGRATILIKKGADDIRVKFCNGKFSDFSFYSHILIRHNLLD